MYNLRVGKAVRRMVMLRLGSSGVLEPTILYEKQPKKKKQTPTLRPLERVVRRFASAQQAYWNSLAQRHDVSNEKTRWLGA
jgi:Family of unknown function (DUF6312)